MQAFERVLLYLTALGVAAALLLSPSTPDVAPESGSAPGEAEPAKAGASRGSEPLLLTDKSGKTRLELRLDEDGEARLAFLSKSGEPAIVLGTRPEGGGEISLRNPRGAGIYLQSEPDGAVEIVVSGQGDSRATLSSLPGGQISLEFNGAHGVSTRMVVSSEGETEIGVGGGQEHPVSAFLRTDRRGIGEIAVRGSDGASGTSLTILPSGDMGIAAKGPDGTTGPMMQLLANGLAQISVTGPDGRAGPALVRFPDGVGTILVRGETGNFGPSMLLRADGTSQIAVSGGGGGGGPGGGGGGGGNARAGILVNAEGRAMLVITDPGGRPVTALPAPAPEEK